MLKRCILTGWLMAGWIAWPALALGAEAAAIFDGQSLTGWDGNPALWSVQDGVITGQTSADAPLKSNEFLIWRGGEVDDFELSLEYRIDGGNSGIQYRSFTVPEVGKWSVGGYQADIDAANTWSGILYGERYRDILGKRGEKSVIGENHKPRKVGDIGDPAELGSKIRKGEWNKYRIVAEGFHFQHHINDTLMADIVDEDKAMRRRTGILALQIHQGPPMKVQFRDIRLKRMPLRDAKKAVFIAGRPSHPYLQHEHRAGCMLLARALQEGMPQMVPAVYANGWPADPTALDNADTIIMYCDGGAGHYVNKHLEEVDALIKKGVGLVCLHYGVEVPKGPPGDRLLEWIGGYFETFWSVNPHWTADFQAFEKHPINRGIKPFAMRDEWYYHMRFRSEMNGVTAILSAIPPEETLNRPDGPHSGNPAVRAEKGKPQHVAWAAERKDGGRGFGFTGGHFHYNWAQPSFRRVVLNAIVWTAGLDVPQGGVPLRPITYEDLLANLDSKRPESFPEYKPDEMRRKLDEWNKEIAQ